MDLAWSSRETPLRALRRFATEFAYSTNWFTLWKAERMRGRTIFSSIVRNIANSHSLRRISRWSGDTELSDGRRSTANATRSGGSGNADRHAYGRSVRPGWQGSLGD